MNDGIALRASAFGDHADRLAGSSVKSMIAILRERAAPRVVTAALALSRDLRRPSTSTIPIRRVISTSSRCGPHRRGQGPLCANCHRFGSKNSAIVIGRVQ
jgi:hypothetical protein